MASAHQLKLFEEDVKTVIGPLVFFTAIVSVGFNLGLPHLFPPASDTSSAIASAVEAVSVSCHAGYSSVVMSGVDRWHAEATNEVQVLEQKVSSLQTVCDRPTSTAAPVATRLQSSAVPTCPPHHCHHQGLCCRPSEQTKAVLEQTQQAAAEAGVRAEVYANVKARARELLLKAACQILLRSAGPLQGQTGSCP